MRHLINLTQIALNHKNDVSGYKAVPSPGDDVEEACEPTISLRWILPFLQVTGGDPQRLELLAESGVDARELATPDVRLPQRVALELLDQALKLTADPGLGLKAAEAIDPGSLDEPVLTARCCQTLRQGIACASRYAALIDESLQAQLVEISERAIWHLWTSRALSPAANDFTLAAAYLLARRSTVQRIELLEVHFRHALATDGAGYARVFGGAEIKLGSGSNALVFRRSSLDVGLSHAHQGLQAVYEARAKALLARLATPESIARRVRQLVIAQLRLGDASMTGVARALGISAATLRRRLQCEDEVFSDILEDVRRELVQEHLANVALTIGEIAKLLGFSHVAAFYKAFRRWFGGTTPLELRSAMRRGRRAQPGARHRAGAQSTPPAFRSSAAYR
jgi:AraC-like DNA-binding protein